MEKKIKPISKMQYCKFCNGEGKIIVLEYAVKGENPYFAHKAYLKETLLADCPKCNGTGKEGKL